MSLNIEQPTVDLMSTDPAIRNASLAVHHLSDALWDELRGDDWLDVARAERSADLCALRAMDHGYQSHECFVCADTAQAVEMVLS